MERKTVGVTEYSRKMWRRKVVKGQMPEGGEQRKGHDGWSQDNFPIQWRKLECGWKCKEKVGSEQIY